VSGDGDLVPAAYDKLPLPIIKRAEDDKREGFRVIRLRITKHTNN